MTSYDLLDHYCTWKQHWHLLAYAAVFDTMSWPVLPAACVNHVCWVIIGLRSNFQFNHQRLNWAGGYQSWAPGPDIAPCWRPAPSPLSWHYQLTYNSFTHCLTNQQERKKSALIVLYLESCLLSFMTFFLLIGWLIDWLIFNFIFKNENKIKQWECCGLYLEELNSFNCYFKAFLFYADNEGETTFRTALRNYSGS